MPVSEALVWVTGWVSAPWPWPRCRQWPAVSVWNGLARAAVCSDSAIAVVWAVGMALGILFIFMTEGYVPELNSFLFGNVLTVTTADLWWFLGFTVVLSAVFLIFYRVIVAVAFDPDFSRVRRLPVRFVNYAMTVMVAVAIVLTIRLVGIMLLMSLLSLPQMIAETRFRRFGSLITASVAISLAGGMRLVCLLLYRGAGLCHNSAFARIILHSRLFPQTLMPGSQVMSWLQVLKTSKCCTVSKKAVSLRP